MPEWTIVDGVIIDSDGKPAMIDEDPITILGVKTQDDIDKVVGVEKGKLQKKIDEANTHIQELEGVKDKSEGLETMLQEAKDARDETQKKFEEVEKEAEAKTASQLQDARDETEKYKTEVSTLQADWLTEQLTNSIRDKTGNFISPKTDIIPHLLATHKREDEVVDGKSTGKKIDLYEVEHKDDDGKLVSKLYPVEDAVKHWGSMHPHQLHPTNRNGSGGGQGQENNTPGEEPSVLKYPSMEGM